MFQLHQIESPVSKDSEFQFWNKFLSLVRRCIIWYIKFPQIQSIEKCNHRPFKEAQLKKMIKIHTYQAAWFAGHGLNVRLNEG